MLYLLYMVKTITPVKKSLTIRLPGENISVGPGTVPTSTASVSYTSFKKMASELRKASKEGLFNNKDEAYGAITSATTR